MKSDRRWSGLLLVLVLGGLALDVPEARSEKGSDDQPLTVYLDDDGSRFIKLGMWSQLWARHTDLNPGSLLSEDGQVQSSVTDFSVRRFRGTLDAQFTERAMVFVIVGLNNVNYLSERGVSLDLFDVWAGYTVSKAFAFGGGKSMWNGFSRYASPAAHRSLTLDIAPGFLPTNNLTDDGLRKLGVWAKGQASGLDYRATVFKPSSVLTPRTPKENEAALSDEGLANSLGVAAYAKWQFFQKEKNRAPAMPGTYLGKLKVLNLGAGFEFQNERMESLENGESVFHDLIMYSVDLFTEIPLGEAKQTAVTAYAAVLVYEFGPNAFRNVGVNNPACCVDPAESSFNGPGNAYTVLGTGQTFYIQGGYLFPPMGSQGQLQAFFDYQSSEIDRLADRMNAWSLGMHWLIDGLKSRLSLGYQSRPIFFNNGGRVEQDGRKGMLVLQYQFWIK